MDKKIIKQNHIPLVSEASSSPGIQTNQFKQLSTPVGLTHTRRGFDIPIKMSALDESDSATGSEDNLPHKTTSDTINLQKTLRFKNGHKNLIVNTKNVKYSKTNEPKILIDSPE